MEVKLKLLQEGAAGRELTIHGPEYVIGRADDCHLRPQSDAVSRRHCALTVKGSQVVVRDLGSKNGTYVNGDRIDGEQLVSMGDQLRVGPLEFLVVVTGQREKELAGGSEKDGSSVSDSGIISKWLEEADAAERDERLADPETRHFKLDKTDQHEADEQDETVEESESKTQEKPGKKEPGKLPITAKEESPKDSREAAAKMLKKFFHRT